MDKKRVLLAIPTLDCFGVQQVVSSLLQHWNKKKYDVRMLLNSRTGSLSDQFPSSIKSFEADKNLLNIPKLRVLLRVLNLYFIVKKFKPDVIISFVPGPNYYCFLLKFLFKLKFKLVVSEHAHVSAALLDKENSDNLFMYIYRRTFKYVYNSKEVDCVNCIAEESLKDLKEIHGINPSKLFLINNPVPIEVILKKSKEEIQDEWLSETLRKNIPIIITVGRLKKQKRHDRLLKSFSIVRKKMNVRLLIVGPGSQKDLIYTSQILGLEKDVRFVGFQSNPWKWLSKASLFVLTSDWEGLPCVLSESMAIGIPVVSADCPSGPNEMLLGGKVGWLFEKEDIKKCAYIIQHVLTNEKERKLKVIEAKKAVNRYDPKYITRKYEMLVEKLTTN